MYRQTFTKKQALQKSFSYCTYQERCHSEVKEKLYSFGLHKNDVEEIVAKLVEENYLNEERFAIQFAGGHFRIKKWGKVKIKYELKQKLVSNYCIKKALSAIDKKDYFKTVQKLYLEKLKSLKSEKNIFIKKRKLQNHLLQKGFELSVISVVIQKNNN